MSKSERLSQSEAANRFSERGYQMLGEYRGRHHKVLLRCGKHSVECETRAGNIFHGGNMTCCGKELMRARLRESMKGIGNNFYGKKHSIETREKLSLQKIGKPSPLRGYQFPNRSKLLGICRTSETKEKISAAVKKRYRSFGFCVRMASRGMTSGKQGIFYIVRIGEKLKFGSTCNTMNYRIHRLRQEHGEVELKIHCFVDDAGSYEATMMSRFKDHWLHGEFFRNFIGT